ncbi:nucleotidyltransferase domain-containing protein [Oceanobacillus senegalensis]|uniref:nucleotidyltransferase domain-containing protein n=1 Tax=Oceanobacillus senegalensis TaxID=1936063 RepID=UPI000A305FB2|nr:nucleotidyltransferase domain-containing protein [Oceanobacillus senegalensis]
MKEIIITKLMEIENKHQIKILFACEAGSRSYGLASEKSDYDVRFIYIHPTTYYLSIDPIGIGKKKDVKKVPFNNALDMYGWDLTKALKLFRKSNPSLLEWLHTDIVYYQAFSTIEKIKEMEKAYFSEKSCIHHYINMSKNNFRRCSEETVNIKLYLNVLRPLLLATWIKEYKEFPPLKFSYLVDKLVPEGKIKRIVNHLIKIKLGNNLELNPLDLQNLHIYIQVELKRLDNYAKSLTDKNQSITTPLDFLFQQTLKEVWS